MILHFFLLALGLALGFWGISALAVLSTPVPENPWSNKANPPEGEYFRVSDNTEIFIRHWLPDKKPQKAILALHGLGQHSGYHRRFGKSLARRGIAYYAFDMRGNGLTRTLHGDIPSIERLYDDVDDFIQYIRQRHPQSVVYVLGHSLGGAFAASWAAERNPMIDGLLILSPAMTATAAPVPPLNYLKGPAAWMFFPHRPVLEIDSRAYARERLSQIINIPEEVDFIVSDELHLRKLSMRFALAANYFRKRTISLAPHIQIPTLTLVGEADPARVGAKQFYDALTVTDKSFILIPDVGHMILQIQETPLIVQEVLAWLEVHNTNYQRGEK